MFVATSSLQCIRNILKEEIPYNMKSLMVAIAMNHDYQHSCQVGMEIVRKHAGMNHRTAYRTIKRMEELGLVDRAKGGKFTRTMFRLTTCGNGEMGS